MKEILNNFDEDLNKLKEDLIEKLKNSEDVKVITVTDFEGENYISVYSDNLDIEELGGRKIKTTNISINEISDTIEIPNTAKIIKQEIPNENIEFKNTKILSNNKAEKKRLYMLIFQIILSVVTLILLIITFIIS